MIIPGISYFPTEENSIFIKNIPMQLPLFNMESYEKNIENIIALKQKYNLQFACVHLPIRTTAESFDTIHKLMEKCINELKTNKFVIHPNRGIIQFIDSFKQTNLKCELCIENFQYRRKKVLRSPLEIAEYCYQQENIKMTIDTSHSEIEWFDYKIMGFLLKYTSVIHLSNRKDKEQHLPFTTQNGDLNLVAFVSDLKRRYNWSGTIILEYMPQYHDKLIINQMYLKRIVGEK